MPLRNVDWRKAGIKLPHCLAPWMVAYIQSDGLVRPCCVHPPTLGDTHLRSMEEIWVSLPYNELRQAMLGGAPLPAVCATCNDGMRYVNVEEYIFFQMEEMSSRGETHQVLRLFEALVQQNVLVINAIPLIALLLEEMYFKGESEEVLRLFETLVKQNVVIGDAIPIITMLLEEMCSRGDVDKAKRLFTSLALNNLIIFDALSFMAPLYGNRRLYWYSFIPPRKSFSWKAWYGVYLLRLFCSGKLPQGVPINFDPLLWWRIYRQFPEAAASLKNLVGRSYSSEEELFLAVEHCIGAERMAECRPLFESELAMIRNPRKLGKELLLRLLRRQ